MTDRERELIRQAFSHHSQEIRAAQRAVEVLANLFESVRRELYPHQASRIWYVLNRIDRLERVPLYPMPENELSFNKADQTYRWHWMDHALPGYGMHRLANDLDELSELLSGKKIEEVAEGKGQEAWMEYMSKTAVPANSTGWSSLQQEPFVNKAVYSREEVDRMVKRGEISAERGEELLRMSYEVKESRKKEDQP